MARRNNSPTGTDRSQEQRQKAQDIKERGGPKSFKQRSSANGASLDNFRRTQPDRTLPQPKVEGALRFLSDHYGDARRALVGIGTHKRGDIDPIRLRAEGEGTARDLFARWNGQSRNGYYHVNKVREGFRGSKAAKADIAEAQSHHVDLDARGDLNWSHQKEVEGELEKLLYALREFPIPPTTIIFSGGGYQALWRLKKPVVFPVSEYRSTDGTGKEVIDKAAVEAAVANFELVNKAIEWKLKAALGEAGKTDGTTDVCRILRIPGLINFPDEAKRKKGRVAVLSYVVERHPDRQYETEDFAELVEEYRAGNHTTTNRGASNAPSTRFDGVTDRDALLAALPQDVRVKVETDPKRDNPDADRSAHFHNVVCDLCEQGLSGDQIVSLIEGKPCVPDRYHNRLQDEVQRCHDKWRENGGRVLETPSVESERKGSTKGRKRLQSALSAIPIGEMNGQGAPIVSDKDCYKAVLGILDWNDGEAGRRIAREWASNRFDEQKIERIFSKYDQGYEGQKITVATVYHIANEHGWDDPQEGKTSQSDILLDAALRECDLFHDSGDECYADIEVKGHRETYSLKSSAFKTFLDKLYYDRTERGCSEDTIKTVCRTLTSKALYEGATREVYLRVAGLDDAAWIDLGRPDWSAVKITAEGWKIVAKPDVRFWRPKNMQPLPLPVRGGSQELLFEELGLEYNEFLLSMVWATHVLRGLPPFLLAYITGPSGSMKTTLGKRLMALTDPPNNKEGNLNTAPKEQDDLWVSAKNNFVLGYDNMSQLSGDMSDAFCILSTGGAREKRKLHTDDEGHIIDFVRPVVITSIAKIIHRQDLIDRSLVIELEPVSPKNRKSRDYVDRRFAEKKGMHFGFLLDLVAGGIRELPSVKLDKLPRMADFAKWGVAVEKALGDDGSLFTDTYIQNRSEALEQLAEHDAVVQAIAKFMESQTEWTGKATDLLRSLDVHGDQNRFNRAWPRTANTLSAHLTRNRQVLEAVGIELSKGKGRGRRAITLKKREQNEREKQLEGVL